MIAGQMSTVAFKVVNSHGAPLDVQGDIVDSKGNVVTGFKTFHDGMGEFNINPQPSERYQAVCNYSGRTLKFNLPEAQTNTFSLKTTVRDNRLLATVNKNPSVSLPKLYLMIHSGGSVYLKKF